MTESCGNCADLHTCYVFEQAFCDRTAVLSCLRDCKVFLSTYNILLFCCQMSGLAMQCACNLPEYNCMVASFTAVFETC